MIGTRNIGANSIMTWVKLNFIPTLLYHKILQLWADYVISQFVGLNHWSPPTQVDMAQFNPIAFAYTTFC